VQVMTCFLIKSNIVARLSILLYLEQLEINYAVLNLTFVVVANQIWNKISQKGNKN
jgi:hypothetical protein